MFELIDRMFVFIDWLSKLIDRMFEFIGGLFDLIYGRSNLWDIWAY